MKRNGITAGRPPGDEEAAIKHIAAEWKTQADAGLSAAEVDELRTWRNADSRHQAALARFDAVWEQLDRPFHAGATDRLLAELNVRARGRKRRRVVSVAAGCLLLFAVGSAWRFNARRERIEASQSLPPAALAANTVLLVPSRQILPDGSVVDLNGDAEIAVDFSAALRKVVLHRGEAHFQVTKDPQRAFVVVAAGVEARAVGTAFAVQIGAAAVEVLVTEGRVAVNHVVHAPVSASIGSSTVPEAFAVLGVSNRLVVDLTVPLITAPRVTAVQSEELDERLAWRAPRVEFTRTSLEDAIKVLNDHSAARTTPGGRVVRFVIADPGLSDVRVSGLFRIDRSEAFVGLLKNGFGIEAEPNADGEIILRKAR